MCGILLIYNSDNLLPDLEKGIKAMEHRGGESTGIAVAQPNPNFIIHREYGIAANLFDRLRENNDSYPRYRSGICGTRYATSSTSGKRNMPPAKHGDITLAHNGNLINFEELQKKYEGRLKSDLDSEILAHIIHDSGNFSSGAKRIMDECEGSYNFVAMDNQGHMAAFRDPHGYHPLFVGQSGDSFYIASENIALTKFDIYKPREMAPGELMLFDSD